MGHSNVFYHFKARYKIVTVGLFSKDMYVCTLHETIFHISFAVFVCNVVTMPYAPTPTHIHI
jgi:hypothetical protein